MTAGTRTNQKADRASAQRVAAVEAASKAARSARLASHNDWPATTLTTAEEKFRNLLGDRSGLALLKPYTFHDVGGRDFHRHLGTLTDGLEMLPKRPDHAFDFFFRTVDELSQQLTGKNKITDAVESIGPWVCNNLASHADWKSFINLFAARLPRATAKFMAQRLLESFETEGDPIRPRAKKLLTQQRYAEFHQKFRGRLTGADSKILAAGANNAGLFVQHLIGSRSPSGSPDPHTPFPLLDLALSKNVFDESRALWALVSLMAFTSRNERFHGSSLSPFRSSKANEATYASYYFEMLFVYTLAVGLMIELFEGCGSITSWLTDMQANMTRLDEIFGKWIK